MVSFAVGLSGLALAVGSIGGAATATEAVPADVAGAQGPGVHVVAVGDIAYAGGPYAETAELARTLRSRAGPARRGHRLLERIDQRSCVGCSTRRWGGFRPMWLPVPGNHEYRTARAAGYREYFNESGGLYWSRKVGSWRVIGLDSEKVSSCQAAQVAQGHAEEAQRRADPGHVAPSALLPR